jgi:hypothetical protein
MRAPTAAIMCRRPVQSEREGQHQGDPGELAQADREPNDAKAALQDPVLVRAEARGGAAFLSDRWGIDVLLLLAGP